MHHGTASHIETPQLIGQSPEIVALRNEIAVAARTSAKVLILGETGVGKEVACPPAPRAERAPDRGGSCR